MMRSTIARRLFGLLATLMLVTVGATVQAAPAVAAVTVPFGSSDGTVWGTVTFNNGYSVVVKGSVYGLSSSPGYIAQGQYFEGNARINCRTTPTRSNGVDGTVRNFSDSMNCSVANIQLVAVHYYNGGYRYTQYVDNPYV
ncbi:hypothetical protein [Micromonospora sp. NPDC092111]|uniref:hypothetical protein n=1 Tax=Micromonospora sp. NPDC092111 TaxID=3364289 RepID=UPI003808AF1B